MIDDVAQLRDIAKDQGWTVIRTQQGHWRFLHPDGKRMVHVGPNGGFNRSTENSIAELRRNGLEIPSSSPSKQPVEEPVTVTTENDPRIALLESTVEAAVQMIEEVGENFTKFREETRATFASLVEAPDRVTPAMLLRESKRLEDLISAVVNKVDPIAAFRAKMRGEVETNEVPAATTTDILFACQFCAASFDSKTGAQVHERQCAENPNRTNVPRTCERCGKKCGNAAGYGAHRKYCAS